MDRESGIAEHPERYSGGILRSCTAAMNMKHRKVPGADKLNSAIVGGAPNDESRKLSGERALAENTAGVFYHAIERKAGGEAAKRSMKVAHEHRRSNPFAGNIPEHEKQPAFGLKEIAVIATYHAGRLIVVADVPA